MRRRVVMIVALASVASVSTGGCGSSGRTSVTIVRTTTATVTKTAPAEPVIYVPQTGGAPTYKPNAIYTSVDAGGIYEIVHWKSYGGNVALADARQTVNDCNPDCATGHRATVTMELRFSGRVPCAGVVAYDQMSIYNASDSDFEGRYVTLSDFCKPGN